MNNLPKQWEHWCRSTGFRPHGKVTKSKFCWYYLKGKGRVWRVNCYNEFQRGDTYDNFDRWALCDIKSTHVPKTFQEFKDAVNFLLKE